MEYFCTNNQAEYEALLFGLEMLFAIGATDIEAFCDSLLVVQLISKVFQCFDESLNVYLDKCLDIIYTLDYFSIAHISRHDNWQANGLAQQASAIMWIMACFIFLKGRCLVLPTEGRPNWSPPFWPLMKYSMQEKIKTRGNPLLIICVILVEGWTGLFGGWLSSIQ